MLEPAWIREVADEYFDQHTNVERLVFKYVHRAGVDPSLTRVVRGWSGVLVFEATVRPNEMAYPPLSGR